MLPFDVVELTIGQNHVRLPIAVVELMFGQNDAHELQGVYLTFRQSEFLYIWGLRRMKSKALKLGFRLLHKFFAPFRRVFCDRLLSEFGHLFL
ncbi:MAG: hypothetical protein MR370_06890 [Ruminococcus sp.]|nr:hypothetical protein [Ruminococcus sp.]